MKTLDHSSRTSYTFAAIGALLLFFTACDTGTDSMNDEEAVTVSGRVTDDNQSSESTHTAKSSEPSATGVEGAVITAVAVAADGSVSTLNGETTTDVNGEFSFVAEGEGATDHIRILANSDGDYESSVIVQVNGRNSVQTRPLTAETHAEAEVYLEAKANDDADSHEEGVMAADVAVFVNGDVAAAINTGEQSAAEIGAAIANSVMTRAEYNANAEAGVDMAAVAVAKLEAFAEYQAELAAASEAEARAEAVAALEEAYVNIFADAGADAETQAELHQAGTFLLMEASGDVSGNAETGLRKKAEIIRTHATALALKAMFEAEGASESTIQAIADARAAFVSEMKAAADMDAIIEAKNDFSAVIDVEVESHFDISSEIRAAAAAEMQGHVELFKSTLAALSIFASTIADEAAEAYATFHAEAKSNTRAVLENSGMTEAEASAAAEIIVMANVGGE